MLTAKSQIPGYFCSDPKVQSWCEEEIRDFNPYRQHYTAEQLLEAAAAKFGLARCYDFEFWSH